MPVASPRKLPRQARSRALFEAILDGATRVLTERGRDALNTNIIAEAAGVSVGSLYQYFPNREAVVAALIERHGRRIHERVAGCLDAAAPATLDEAVARIVAAVFAAHRMDPALHEALDHDMGHYLHDHAHLGTKGAVCELIAELPQELRAGIVRADLAQAGVVVSEIAHSLAHVALHSGTGGALEAEAGRAALAYLRTT